MKLVGSVVLLPGLGASRGTHQAQQHPGAIICPSVILLGAGNWVLSFRTRLNHCGVMPMPETLPV